MPTLDVVEIYEDLLRICFGSQSKFFKCEMELLIIIASVKLAQGTHATPEVALRNNETGFPYWNDKAAGGCCIMSVLGK